MTRFGTWNFLPLTALATLVVYMAMVRFLRYRRKTAIEAPYVSGKRSLSEMTTEEAHNIISQLQGLEFPSAFGKARKIALLKVRARFLYLAVHF